MPEPRPKSRDLPVGTKLKNGPNGKTVTITARHERWRGWYITGPTYIGDLEIDYPNGPWTILPPEPEGHVYGGVTFPSTPTEPAYSAPITRPEPPPSTVPVGAEPQLCICTAEACYDDCPACASLELDPELPCFIHSAPAPPIGEGEGDDPLEFIAVEFVSFETLVNALDGYGVEVEMIEGDSHVGCFTKYVPASESQTMVRLMDTVTGELIFGTDVRNMKRIRVL